MSEVVLAMASELKEDVVLDQAIVNKTGHQGNSANMACLCGAGGGEDLAPPIRTSIRTPTCVMARPVMNLSHHVVARFEHFTFVAIDFVCVTIRMRGN